MAPQMIRKAIKSDIPSIVRFNHAMAQETEEYSLDLDVLNKGVEYIINDDSNGFYIVCEIDEVVKACLMITYEWSDWRNGFFWWIQSVYVEKGSRQKGLYKLMYEYIKTLVDQEVRVVGLRLYVDKDNRVAQNVYQKLGMEKSNYQLFEYEKKSKQQTHLET